MYPCENPKSEIRDPKSPVPVFALQRRKDRQPLLVSELRLRRRVYEESESKKCED